MRKISVPASMAQPLQAFLDTEAIALEITSDQPGDIAVIKCDDHKESNLDTIYSGGWITCERARAAAKKISIPVRQMGKLLNHLDVKIRQCGLGCFK